MKGFGLPHYRSDHRAEGGSHAWRDRTFCNLTLFLKNFMFGPLDDLMSFLDPLLGAIYYGVEVTQLGAIVDGAKLSDALDSPAALALRWWSSAP